MGTRQLRLTDLEQAYQFTDRRRMVLDVKIDIAIGQPEITTLFTHHQQRGRLASAGIAAGRLPCCQRIDQACGKVSRGRLECRRHRVHDLWPGQQVALNRIIVAGAAASPRQAFLTGVACRAASLVHDPDLALATQRIRLHQLLNHVLGRLSIRQQSQPLLSVKQVAPGLGRDRPGLGGRMWDHGPNRKVAGLNRDAIITGLGVQRDDGKSGYMRCGRGPQQV